MNTSIVPNPHLGINSSDVSKQLAIAKHIDCQSTISNNIQLMEIAWVAWEKENIKMFTPLCDLPLLLLSLFASQFRHSDELA